MDRERAFSVRRPGVIVTARVNITPTMLRKKIENVREVRASLIPTFEGDPAAGAKQSVVRATITKL
jgi:hypothetical protein